MLSFSLLLFVYVGKQSCLFLDDKLYRKILVRRQGFLSQWQCKLAMYELFHKGFRAIMTRNVCYESFYGKAYGIQFEKYHKKRKINFL